MSKKRIKFDEGIKLKPTTNATTEAGELRIDSADSKLKAHLDGVEKEILSADQAATLQNKTIDSASNTITVDADEATVENLEADNLKAGVLNTDTALTGATDSQIPSALAVKTFVEDSIATKDQAAEISYDNTTSGLVATQVQAAIDEVEGRLDTAEADVDTAQLTIDNHIADAVDAHDASAISFNNVASGLAATEVQAAIDEVEGRLETAEGAITSGSTALNDHLVDAVDAHDASAISVVPAGNLAATDAQAALEELQSDIDTRALASDLSDHLADITDAHDASAISVVPAGNLAATDAQAALEELQSDIDTRALNSDLTTHTSASSGVHGVTGDVVGTTDSQTLTNKTIQGASIQDPVRLDPKKDTKANLDIYATTAQNGELVFATDEKQAYQVVDGVLVGLGGGAGVGDVDTLSLITTFDTSLGLTDVETVNGPTFRLTHDALATQFAEATLEVTPKFRGKNLRLFTDILTTALSGNFKLIVTDETNASAELVNEVLTPQAGAAPEKRFVTFDTAANTESIKVRFEALAEAGSPTSDFDDVVIQLTKSEKVVSEVYELEENEFSARLSNNGSAITTISQSSPFIQSIVRDGVGRGTVTFVPGFFTEVPEIQLTPSVNNDYYIASVVSPTTTGFSFVTSTISPLAFSDFSVNVHISRQGADRKDLTRRVERTVSSYNELVVQEDDTVLRLVNPQNGLNTLTFQNVVKSEGSAISHSGGIFTAHEEGLFHFHGTLYPNTQANYSARVNSSGYNDAAQTDPSIVWLDTLTGGSSEYNPFSFEVYLKVGDELVINNSGAAITYASTTSNFLEVNKVGSLKLAQTIPDSKIEIPSSEVRMEDTTGVGTGAESWTVAYTTLSKIRGNALEVNNSNGTLITVKKDGYLSINTSFRMTTSGRFAWITKNSATPNTQPLISEILQAEAADSTSAMQCLNWSGQVKAGDVLRVIAESGTAPASPNGNNVLEIYFQETKIAVAVTNIQPQFEDADSNVRLDTGNGFGSVANRIRRFSNVRVNVGEAILYQDSSTDGASFTIQEDGVYQIAYGEQHSGSTGYFGLSLNASSLTTDIFSLAAEERLVMESVNGGSAGDFQSVAWSQKFVKGDVIRPHIGGTQPNGSTAVAFSITKAGKPSIAVADLTPFVDTPDVIKQNYRISQPSTELLSNTDAQRYNLSGAQIISSGKNLVLPEDDASNSQTKFVAQQDCTVNVYAFARTASIREMLIFKNGSFLISGSTPRASTDVAAVSGTVEMRKGDYLTFGVGSIGTFDGSSTANIFPVTFGFTAEAIEQQRIYNVAQVENEFSARIANNGVASIVSQSYPFIESVSRTAAGLVTVNFKAGFFTETPSIEVTAIANGHFANLTSLSATQAFVQTQDHTGASNDQQFNINISRQGADRRDLQKAIVKLDDFPRVNRTLKQQIRHESATLLENTNELKFNLANLIHSGDNSLIAVDNDSAVSSTRFVALRKCLVNYSASMGLNGTNSISYVTKNGSNLQNGSHVRVGGDSSIVAGEVILEKGEYITIGASPSSTSNVFVSIVAEAQELERVINIDKVENNFSARIPDSGVIAERQNTPWISDISWSSNIVTINLVAGMFSEPLNLAAIQDENGAFRRIQVITNTTSQIVIVTENAAGAFNLHAQRSEGDYKSIQDVAAVLFTPKVAYLKDVKAQGSNGQSIPDDAWTTRDLNTIEGDSEIVSLSSNQFTLQPGKYSIEWHSPQTNGGNGKTRLRNITDSTDAIVGGACGTSSVNGEYKSFGQGTVELTDSKTFAIQHYLNQGATIGGQALNLLGYSEIYTQIKITKLS